MSFTLKQFWNLFNSMCFGVLKKSSGCNVFVFLQAFWFSTRETCERASASVTVAFGNCGMRLF